MLSYIFLSAFFLCINSTLPTFTYLSRPKNLRVSHSSDPTLVNIFWSPPENPNGEITGYDILYTDNNSLNDRKWKRERISGQKTTIALTKLIQNSVYHVKIKAIIDGSELGPPSDVIEFITKSSSPHSRLSSLSMPKILQVVSGKDSSVVKITWRAPKDPIVRIKRYEIYYTGDRWFNMPNGVTNVKIIDRIQGIDDINDIEEITEQIDGLLPNTNYKFIIQVKTSENNVGTTSSVFEFLTKSGDKNKYSGNYKPIIKKNKIWELIMILIWPLLIIFFIYLMCSCTGFRDANTEQNNAQSSERSSFDHKNENRENDSYDFRSETVSTLSQEVENCKRRLEQVNELKRLNPKDSNALVNELECLLLLGEPSSAMICLQTIENLNLKKDLYKLNIEKLMKLKNLVEQADNYFKLENYSAALYTIKNVILISPASVKFHLMKAEFLVMLGSHSEAQIIIDEVLKFENLNVEALYLRGLSLYYQDEIQISLQYFEKLLQLCPDHTKAYIVYKNANTLLKIKEEGNEAFKKGNYQRACEIYSSALSIDPLNKMINAKLYFNRSLARAKINQLNEALADCDQALKLNENYMKAHHKRAKLLTIKGMFREAVREYEWIYLADPSEKNKRLLKDTKMKLKISEKKDYYKILGVSRTAGIEEIRKAYLDLALKHHPDKHSNASETEKMQHEKTMKDVNEAYGVLADLKKRSE